ncbi:hypothetical protein [Dactylosporangium sp. NPDC049140]|uniref:hypothetical protein n=1 Tax=Dactylosporangium sp. NPDC049140 TaxID=3155647 RepID=UPI0034060000
MSLFRSKTLWITVGAVVVANVAVFGLASRAGIADAAKMAASADANLVVVALLIGVIWWLTRKRAAVDLAARAPERRRAGREVAGVLAYAAAGQVVGALLGWLPGEHPISFHLAGTLYGHQHVTPYEAYVWAGYNFVVYALLPWLYFRQRYTAEQLSLRSSNRRNDLLVIVVVMVLESLNEIGGLSDAILHLSASQLLKGVPAAFGLYLLGSVLPTMVLVYSILLPRYRALTRSVPATVVLGGLTYALLHFFEAWTVLTSPAGAAVSIGLLLLQYTGPGMVKSVLTLRTGNAWVHVWAYHAVAPHTIVDTPHVVGIFNIR